MFKVTPAWLQAVSILLLITQDGYAVAECGGELAQGSGVITTPLYPFSYPDNTKCQWTIVAPPDEVVDLRFKLLDLEGYRTLCPDYVKVYDGDSTDSPHLAELCGIKNKEELSTMLLRSTGNTMTIAFASDSSGPRPGFMAIFWTQKCQQFMYGIDVCNQPCDCVRENAWSCDGVNGTCACKNGWTSEDCSVDVDECTTSEAELCTQSYKECINVPGTYECACRAGLIKNTRGECVDSGECTEKKCSHLCAVTRTTPRYEKCYCPRGMHLDPKDGVTCIGCDEFTYGQDCLKRCPCNIDNTESCDAVTGACNCKDGWQSIDCTADVNECSLNPCLENEQCVNLLGSYSCLCKRGFENITDSCQECGRVITETSGAIVSHNYDYSFYDRTQGEECSWTISVKSGTINIMFDTFEMYRENSKQNGSVVIYDGRNSNSTVIGTYYGNKEFKPPSGVIKSTSNEVHIVRLGTSSTSNYYQYPLAGFHVSFSSHVCTKKCSHLCVVASEQFNIEECRCPYGMTLDPADDTTCIECDDWTYGKDCKETCKCSQKYTQSCNKQTGQCLCYPGWTSSDCSTDFNECSNSSICGDNGVCYNSWGTYTCQCYRGFELVDLNGICEECGRELTEPSGTIVSGTIINGYDEDYIECSWTIRVEDSKLLSLKFDKFDLYGFVKIYDGDNPDAPEIGTYRSKPDDVIRSTANVLHIERYGSRNQRTGFEATYWSFAGNDECYADPLSCPEYSECTEVNGNFECSCWEGLQKNADGNCEVKPDSVCTGTQCSHICVKTSSTVEQCYCPLGMTWDATQNTCTDCSPLTYGRDCSKPCPCVSSNTDSCDSRSGECTCSQGWISSDCSEDFDECRAGSSYCSSTTSECTNTLGSYTCECSYSEGYYTGSDGTCVPNNCSRNLTSPYGEITSPDYPQNVYDHASCTWIITAKENQVVSFRLINVDFSINYEHYGSVKVFDGAAGTSSLGTYFTQGPNDPLVVVKSASNIMRVDFRSQYYTNRGFRATYITHECPRYTYGLLDCALACSCVQDNTEYCNSTDGRCVCKEGWTSDDCSEDVNECLSNPCPDYSDCANLGGTFECICWEGLQKNSDDECEVKQDAVCPDGSTCSHACALTTSEDTSALIEQCYCPSGMRLNGKTCEACTDLTYGNDCSLNCDCAEGKTESCDGKTGECTCLPGWTSDDCSEDLDECRSSNLNLCYQNHANCENTIGNFICNCRPGYIKMDNGTCLEIDCSNNFFTGDSGDVVTDGYPDDFPISLSYCAWTISVRETRVISFSFSDIDFTYSCPTMFIELYDGNSGRAKLLYRYCRGDTAPEVISSTANSMYIIMAARSSLSSNTGRGFKGSYISHAVCKNKECSHICDVTSTNPWTEECLCPKGMKLIEDGSTCENDYGCNRMLTETSGHIQSPGYPWKPDIVPCNWTIVAPVNSIVSLRVSDMYVYLNNKCTVEYIKVYDGSTTSSQVIGSFCGNTHPELLRSTGNKMLITIDKRYTSSTYRGFNATYVTHACPEFTYGDTCEHSCVCTKGNTQFCDNINGLCICKPGWMGYDCSLNVDECASEISPCPQNSLCEDIKGGYTCTCKPGYDLNENTQECEVSSDCSLKMIFKCSHSCFIDTFGVESCACPDGLELGYDGFNCAVPLYPHGEKEAGDHVLSLTNTKYEFTKIKSTLISAPILYSAGVPLGDYGVEKTAYVHLDGVISFGEPMLAPTPDINEAYIDNQRIIAPFWAKTDPNKGQALYHLYEKCSPGVFSEPEQFKDAPKKEEVMERASKDITEFYDLFGFDVSTVLIVTWQGVQPLTWGPQVLPEENTFQAILISGYCKRISGGGYEDEETSYVIFVYRNGQMNWNYKLGRKIDIGYATGSQLKQLSEAGTKVVAQLDMIMGNSGYRGQVTFPVGRLINADQKCQRYVCRHSYLMTYPPYIADVNGLYKCPCTIGRLGPQWGLFQIKGKKNDIYCYTIREVAKTRLLPDNERNRLCCYQREYPKTDKWEDDLEAWHSSSFIEGHILIADPYVSWSRRNYNAYLDSLENRQARGWCSSESSDPSKFFNRYNQIFPDEGCSLILIYVPAFAIGDPHIQTLNGRTYTMNGWGEYIMMDIPTQNFTLQARTERAVAASGALTNATVYTAFAAKESYYASFQVELASTNTTMVVLANGIDITNAFYSKSYYSMSSASLSINRENIGNRTSVVATFPSGISVKVHVGFKSLDIGLMVDYSLRGKTRGLLGTFSGNTNDDFLLPNGTVLSPDMTEKEIFAKFAKEYTVTVQTSVFLYAKGKRAADYQHPEFVPMFTEDVDPSDLVEAKKVCGEENDACIFDYIATKDEEFAKSTNDSEKEIDIIMKGIKNHPPTLLEPEQGTQLKSLINYRWVVKESQQNSVQFIGYDEEGDVLTWELVGNATGVNLTQNGVISYSPNPQRPVKVGLRVKDSEGAYSSIVYITIAVCPNCNSRGECNTNVTTAVYEDGYYQILKCDCHPAYTGVHCESELDACTLRPCSERRECTDLTAAEQGDDIVGYKCGPCTDGFRDVNETCADIDECSDSSVCEQNCINTEGSYLCSCEPGYRLDVKDKMSCLDINECEERTSDCQQECRNTEGNYACACKQGYTLNDDELTCKLDASYEDACQECDQACIVKSGEVTCDCNLGYRVDEFNQTRCIDIDECSGSGKSPCSHICTNTEGGFECSCYQGHSVDQDDVSCSPCQSPYYGNNCSNICECRGRGSCDSVRGCVCDESWTGPNCDIDVNECEQSDACPAGQVCRNEIGSYRCECQAGYKMMSGVCIDIDECSESFTNMKCNLSTEVCVNNKGNYSCNCKDGYARGKDGLCQDINECEMKIDGCEHFCLNGPGGYSCDCSYYYKLTADRQRCEKVKDICDNQCDYVCAPDASGKPVCHCPRGYQSVGSDVCEDINECESQDTNLCDYKAGCVNIKGSYNCSCEPGSKLDNDGRSCVVCTGGTWGPECSKTCACGVGAERCDPVEGCVCKPGFSGKYCTNVIDYCANDGVICDTNDYVICGANEECVNTPEQYVCKCHQGFQWVNGICQDINECVDVNLHTCDQVCTNTVGSFTCSCYNGYRLNNSTNTCSDVDECEEGTSLCQQNCTNALGSYRCSCESDLILQPDGLTCGECPNGLTGCSVECNCVESNTKECDGSSGQCTCKEGWTSDDCSLDIDECLENPCPKYLQCRNLDGSHECLCWSGLPVSSNGSCADCNRTLTEMSGNIMTTNYPDFYTSNTYCTWTISLKETNAIIVFNFLEYFVEGCPYDYAEIYDGPSTEAPLLGRFCFNVPQTVTSTGSELHVVFTSDGSINQKGFRASYTSKLQCKDKACSHDCTVTSTEPWTEECVCPEWMKLDQDGLTCVDTHGCNSIITDPTGYIVSPLYPQFYPDNANCYWEIQGTPNSVVALSFFEFSVEASVNCPYDALEIHDGNSANAPLLGRFCGNELPGNMTSTGNAMYIVFHSDVSVGSSGFKLTYNLIGK